LNKLQKRSAVKALVLILLATFAVTFLLAEPKEKKPPTVVSAKTVSFVTFLTGPKAGQLTQQATDLFKKWKYYQVLADPSQADLIVLLGPMPRKVSEEVFDAIIAGRPAPQPLDLTGAAEYFAVFDGVELRSAELASVKPLWNTEMPNEDLRGAVKKYKKLVDETSDTFYHDRDVLSKCLALGERCQR
jgi:hypothetical protein